MNVKIIRQVISSNIDLQIST